MTYVAYKICIFRKMRFWSHCYTMVSYHALFRQSVYTISAVYLSGAKNVCFCTIGDFDSLLMLQPCVEGFCLPILYLWRWSSLFEQVPCQMVKSNNLRCKYHNSILNCFTIKSFSHIHCIATHLNKFDLHVLNIYI